MTQTTPPQVVVACAWYNRADYIRGTVDSLLAQDFDSYEVVIVNDGSSDPKVREILDSYDDPRLRVIHQENTGFVGAIRRAIEVSEAPYIAIQGSADVSHPERLRKQWEVLSQRDDVAAVGCRLENVLDYETGDSKIYGTPIDCDARRLALKRVIMMHGEVAYRRDLYNKVGGYRDLFKFSQDRDLWCRLSREGRIVVLDDVLYKRYANIGGVSGNAEKQMIQRFLSHFAVYCHSKVLSGYEDPLDKHGSQAGLIYPHSFALQIDLIKLALRYFRDKKNNDARKILDVSGGISYGVLSKIVKFFICCFPNISLRAIKIRDHLQAKF